MLRVDALRSDNYPVRTEMTTTKQITNLHICSTDERELKKFLVDRNLSQICSTQEDESKGIIVYEYSTEEKEPKCGHKNINKKKTEGVRHSMSNIQLQMKCQFILTY